MLAAPVERSFTRFEGVDLETLAWGRRGAPGILLIHGFGAAADWWAGVGFLLAGDWRVVALSCSGNGRSGWRDHYDIDLYKRESLACAEAGGALDSGSMAVVAHSFGAIAGARLSAQRPDVNAFVVLDRAVVQEKRSSVPREGPAREKRFNTRESAMASYRLQPQATEVDPRLMRHVAGAAVREVKDGAPEAYWTWRTDPAMRRKLTERQASIAGELAGMSCPRCFVHGSRSTLFLPEEAEEVRAGGIPVITIPMSGHQLMLEQPVATATAIETFLRVLAPAGIGRRVQA